MLKFQGGAEVAQRPVKAMVEGSIPSLGASFNTSSDKRRRLQKRHRGNSMKTETNRTRPGDKGKKRDLKSHWLNKPYIVHVAQLVRASERSGGRGFDSRHGRRYPEGSSLKSEGSKAQSQQGCMAQERKDGARKETSGNALGVVMLSCWQRISQGFSFGQRINFS
jgi:hypothetical protein